MGKILVVDDREDNRTALRYFLDGKGYDVLEVGGGEEAIGIIKKYNRDIPLVITDYQMPIMDGIELTKWLKSTFPEIKVILISSYDRSIIEEAALTAGADDFVDKSDIKGLEVKIKKLLQPEPELRGDNYSI